MSISGGVIGIDFGTDTCVISQAKRGGIDTVMNEASQRKTHSMVGFQGNERFIGAAAFPLSKSNYKNTVRGFKRLLGVSFNDEYAQREIANLPNKNNFVELENGMIGVKVNYNGATTTFSMEQITAMLLNKLRATVDNANLPSDVVISVPGWWNEKQRRALLNSCSIAGFSALRILNDHTAAALSYGIYKSARNVFDKEKKQIVMFIDIGYSSTCVAIVGFIQGKLEVLAAAYDPNLGGRNFDKAIFEKCVKDFKEKHKLDIMTNPKSILKLRQACEKAKHTLTPEGVNQAKIAVEFLMNEIDFKSEVTLQEFEQMSEGLLAKLKIPVDQCLEKAKLSKEDIQFVEIIGGGTRPKIVKRALAEYMALDATKLNYGLSTTLNSDESIARGCALNSAMLSPVFRVKEFNVCDIVSFPIKLAWEEVEPVPDEEATDVQPDKNSVVIVQSEQLTPCTKRVTFRRGKDFDIWASYQVENIPEAAFLPKDFDLNFSSYKICVDNKKKENELDKLPLLRVNFTLDKNGLFKLLNAEALHEIAPEPEKPKESVEKKVEDESKTSETETNNETVNNSQNKVNNSEKSDSPEDSSKTPTEKSKSDGKKEKKENKEIKPEKKKIRYRKVKLKTNTNNIYGLKQEELQKFIDIESKLSAADKEIEATNAAKNALEAYIYSYRDKVVGDLSEYVTEDEKQSFQSALQKEESWLYDEGFDEKLEEYSKRLDALRKVGERFDIRQRESVDRPKAVKALELVILNFSAVVTSKEEMYDHITEEERKKVQDKINEVSTWLKKLNSKQEEMATTADPVLTAQMIKEQLDTLNRVGLPIVNKKRPPPPKPKVEEKMDVEKEDKKNEENKTEPTDEANGKNPEENSDTKKPVDGMEVD